MKVVRHHLRCTEVDAMSRYDIAIAGAGPAGSVLAALAARARYRVLLVEKSHFERPRFGETAPPELRQALTHVGLERLAQAPFCREAPEVLSVWGSDEPWSRHHIFSPYGTALHLDRRAFDEALALAARDAGADLKLGCAARFSARPRGGYSVQLSTGERIRTKAAILATGRAGGGLGLPYVREYLDNNVAVAARLSSPVGPLDPRTVIEAVPGGWFYLAALPGNEIIVVLITLATLVPSERRARLRWWLEALTQTTVARNALNGCRLPQTLSVANARASFCSIRCRRRASLRNPDRTRGADQQPASLRWLRYALGPTHRGRTRNHESRAVRINGLAYTVVSDPVLPSPMRWHQ